VLPVLFALLTLALAGACGGDEGGAGPAATPVATATPSPAEAEALLAEREARSLARDPSPQATAPAPQAAPSGADEVLTVGARLLDPEANALSGGTLVWLAAGSGFLTEMRGSARSDGTGAAWLRIPWNQLDSSEQLILALHADGHVRLELRLEPERWMASPLLNLGEMTLAPGGVVSGRVLDAAGAGVAGAVAAVTLELGARTGLAREMARVWPLYEGVGVAGVVPVVRCGADGAFTLAGVPPGRFDVLAAPYGGAIALLPDREEHVEVRAGATTRVRDLVLRPPAPEELIRGRVIAPDGAPVPEAWIALAQADGMEIYEGRTQTGADGTFALPAMKDTVYRLLALDGQGRWPQAEIPDVRPGGAEVIVPFTR
jgi:hypothetical protein